MISHDSMMSFLQSSDTRGTEEFGDKSSTKPLVQTVVSTVVESSAVIPNKVKSEQSSSPDDIKRIKLEKSKFVTPKLVKKEVFGEKNPSSVNSQGGSEMLKDLHFYKNKHKSLRFIPVITKPVLSRTVKTKPMLGVKTKPVDSSLCSSNQANPVTILSQADKANHLSFAKPADSSSCTRLTRPVVNILQSTTKAKNLSSKPVGSISCSKAKAKEKKAGAKAELVEPPVAVNDFSVASETDANIPCSATQTMLVGTLPNMIIQIKPTANNDEPETIQEVNDIQSKQKREKFKCEKCLKTFSYLKRFNDHQIQGNCDKVINCLQCGIKVKDAKNLKSHIKNVHERPIYQCGDCSKFFPSQKTVQNHLNSFHMKNECIFCKKIFKNANTLRSHISSDCVVRRRMRNPATEENVKETNEGETEDEGQEKEGKKPSIGGEDDVPKDIKVKTKAETDEKFSKAAGYRKKCSVCESMFMSKGGYNKHLKTHRKMDENLRIKQFVSAIDTNIIEQIEGLDGTHFILEDDESSQVETDDVHDSSTTSPIGQVDNENN